MARMVASLFGYIWAPFRKALKRRAALNEAMRQRRETLGKAK